MPRNRDARRDWEPACALGATWSTRIAGSTASGAGISSDTMRAADAVITYSSAGKSGLARLGRIAPKGGQKRKTGDGI